MKTPEEATQMAFAILDGALLVTPAEWQQEVLEILLEGIQKRMDGITPDEAGYIKRADSPEDECPSKDFEPGTPDGWNNHCESDGHYQCPNCKHYLSPQEKQQRDAT